MLKRIAQVFFESEDHRTILQAGKEIAVLCGHKRLPGESDGDDEARLLEAGERCVTNAMEASGDDRLTAISKLLADNPEFSCVAQQLRDRKTTPTA